MPLITGPVTAAPLETIASPLLWAISVAGLLVLLALDFAITRRPHEVRMREAVGWTIFYLALPLLFGVYVWLDHGTQPNPHQTTQTDQYRKVGGGVSRVCPSLSGEGSTSQASTRSVRTVAFPGGRLRSQVKETSNRVTAFEEVACP